MKVYNRKMKPSKSEKEAAKKLEKAKKSPSAINKSLHSFFKTKS